MIQCEIAVADKKSMYMHQIITGFTVLAKAGRLEYVIKEDKNLAKEFFHNAIIEVKFKSGKTRVIYDLTDGYNNFPSFAAFDEALKHVDIYYKANVCKQYHKGMKNEDKIRVLAPRYYVTCRNSWLNKVDYSKIFLKRDREELKGLYYKLPWVKNAERNRYIEVYEQEATVKDNPYVFFYTRLWNPEIASSYSSKNMDLDGDDVALRIRKKNEEYAKVTELRAGLVRALKREFGKQFIGGIAPDEFSRKYYSELIGEEDMSRRRDYTHNMHRSEICVNTQGTHQCWNFSFGEELAASRAIVTEKPFYEIPQYLEKEKNFLLYSSIDECIEQVLRLTSDKEKLYKMMCNNKEYYEKHLRPDRLVWDTIKEIMEQNNVL